MELNIKALCAGNLFRCDNEYGQINELEYNDSNVTFNGLRSYYKVVEINELKPITFSDIDLINMFNPTIVRSMGTTTFCFGDGENTITIDFNVGDNQYIEGKNADMNITKCTKTLYIHDIQNIANAIGMNIEDKIFNYYKYK